MSRTRSDHPKKTRRIRWWWPALLVALAALTAAAPPAFAQETGNGAGDANGEVAEKEPPRTVPMTDIGVESERAKRRLMESHRGLEPSEDVEAAAATIPDLRKRVEQQIERSEATRNSSPSVLSLDRVQKGWGEIRELLEATQATLRKHGAVIEKHVATIRGARTLWSATRDQAVQLEVSEEVVLQIDEVLTAAREAGAAANERQARVLSLQSDVASLSEQAGSDERLIAEARNQAVGEVLQRDVAPVWSADFWHGVDATTVGEQLRRQERRDSDHLAQYWAKERDLIVVFSVLSVLLVVGIYTTRGRIDAHLADDEDLAPVRAIFKRPIALSMLVAFFASLWIFSELANTFEPVFGAATLIPAVLILRQIVDRPLFPLLTVGMSVYFAHQLHELVAEAVVVSRLIFLAEMAALASFTALTLRPSRLADIPPELAASRLFRIVGHGLRLVLLTAVMAFGAEAVGYSALANLVGGAVVMGIYASIVLYGTVQVLDGLVVFLLRVRPLRQLGMVRGHQALLRHRVHRVMTVGAWFILIRAVLRRLELWDDVEGAWAALIGSELPFPEITLTLGDVLSAVVVFWGALLASRFLQFVLAEDVFSRMAMEGGRPYSISTLLHYSFLMLGFVLAVAALGFDANRATLLTGAFGVGIGFGLQTIVNNFISGLILLTERPIQVGDTIAMGETFGKVQRIGIRSSTVRTWQGAEVIVPNADLIAQQVTNWTKSDRRRRMEIPVGVKYGTDPERVLEVLLEAAKGTQRVMTDPAPYAVFQGFGDSSLDFEVRAWTDNFDDFMSVRSAICVAIAAALREAGIEVPFPQRDLHVKTLPSETPATREPSSASDGLSSPNEGGGNPGSRPA